jgi:Asp-tRNA(Asn)/Glu-tRNA(Gln) amidotransferase A subunit family amidase
VVLMSSVAVTAQPAGRFDVQEATIAQIHARMKAGQLTCRSLVELYLERIDAFDKKGPAVNAIVVVNPNAVQEADDLDRRFKT